MINEAEHVHLGFYYYTDLQLFFSVDSTALFWPVLRTQWRLLLLHLKKNCTWIHCCDIAFKEKHTRSQHFAMNKYKLPHWLDLQFRIFAGQQSSRWQQLPCQHYLSNGTNLDINKPSPNSLSQHLKMENLCPCSSSTSGSRGGVLVEPFPCDCNFRCRFMCNRVCPCSFQTNSKMPRSSLLWVSTPSHTQQFTSSTFNFCLLSPSCYMMFYWSSF